jgi:hypothetical protein
MSGNAKLLKKIDKINPEVSKALVNLHAVLIAASPWPQSPVESRMHLQTDLVKDNQDAGPHHDPGDEDDENPAPVFQVLRVQLIAVPAR